jgi:transcriptional regulator with XRE-family HTH domain
MEIHENIGRQIKIVRIARGMSRQQVADATGIHPTMLSRFEGGSVLPNREKLELIARAMSWDIKDTEALETLGVY